MASSGADSSMRTRAQDALWLVGQPVASITGSKLPSIQQALALFFYQHKVLRKTVRDSASSVAKDVMAFWNKARIPTKQERNVIPRIERLFES